MLLSFENVLAMLWSSQVLLPACMVPEKAGLLPSLPGTVTLGVNVLACSLESVVPRFPNT